MISRVLVANRGEIARRVFRTCREMGISTVAIFSEADAGEPHVVEADQSIPLQGVAARETYLNIEAILAAVKEAGADAIHPGYGFLAENSGFARAVVDAGLIWIGPSPGSIEAMGSKLTSKRLMNQAGVPTLDSVAITGLADVRGAAAALGYPVLVKASAGGGGKGMRVVDEPTELDDAIESAAREAAGAFGDDTLFLEKYLSAPRHIEVQVVGDETGTIVSLFERECSIQRRHQKIIEEAPSPAIDHETREAMSKAAIEAAQAVDYVGAGTVEFLYQDGEFFFLEMNTRLQVEHPVTEMITGVDLVRVQIEIANGLTVAARGFRIDGHAIEARLYAEDPLNDFLPVSGEFHRVRFPNLEGLRVDSAIEDGSSVSVHYDPMIGKVIAHGPTRESAASTLATALRTAELHGSTTNRALLVRILEHPEFLAGGTDTLFLRRHDPAQLGRPLLDLPEERMAAVAAALADQAHERTSAVALATIPSGWRNSPASMQRRSYTGDWGTHGIEYSIGVFDVDGVGQVTVGSTTPDSVTFTADGVEQQYRVARYGDQRYIDSKKGPAHLMEVPRFHTSDAADDRGSLHAPMPGKVIKVSVAVGDEVSVGDTLVVMEAMKMEHTLRSPHFGVVRRVACAPGDQVDAGSVLVVVDADR